MSRKKAGTTKYNANDFSQFAWRKSIIVSNAIMRAARYADGGASIDELWANTAPLVESHEKSPTGLKGDKTPEKTKLSDSNLTIAEGRYPMIPPGYDSLALRFEIKVVNATDFPQSAKLDTWEKMRSTSITVGGQTMSLHDAVRCRARDVFALVAQQVFSGTWAWRNDAEALDKRIAVFCGQRRLESADALAQDMYNAFTNKTPAAWEVVGLFKVGYGASSRAYPSQLFKDNGSKEAEFYKIPGTSDFGMRSVKIGNRLKTIDVWYDKYDVLKLPIPVEPLGYFHSLRANLRDKGETAVGILQEAVDSNGPKHWDEKTALYMTAITLFGGLITAQNAQDGSESADDGTLSSETDDGAQQRSSSEAQVTLL